MAPLHDVSRRTALKLTGAAASATVLAGCGSSDNPGEGNDSGGSNGGEGGIQVESGAEILFSGQTSHWEGNSAPVEGEQNPTLVLTEGETYTIGWNEGNGTPHNMELRDSNGEVVGDYGTSPVAEPGDDQIFEFEATSEITTYRCQPHPSMEGDIVVE